MPTPDYTLIALVNKLTCDLKYSIIHYRKSVLPFLILHNITYFCVCNLFFKFKNFNLIEYNEKLISEWHKPLFVTLNWQVTLKVLFEENPI